MNRHFHYCPTCATKRPSISYRCTLCGTPVRLSERPVVSGRAA